jgi:hypothetical protein
MIPFGSVRALAWGGAHRRPSVGPTREHLVDEVEFARMVRVQLGPVIGAIWAYAGVAALFSLLLAVVSGAWPVGLIGPFAVGVAGVFAARAPRVAVRRYRRVGGRVWRYRADELGLRVESPFGVGVIGWAELGRGRPKGEFWVVRHGWRPAVAVPRWVLGAVIGR